MLKKFVSSLLAVFLLVACGSSTSAGTSPAKDAEAIVNELGLSGKMDQIQDRVVKGLFFFEEGTIEESAVYIANDKTADVVGVFKAKDTAAAKEKIEAYLASAKEQMQNYYPDEVFKIDNAIIEEKGDKIILIVTNDIEAARKKAQEILG
jgi:hypothetical protein